MRRAGWVALVLTAGLATGGCQSPSPDSVGSAADTTTSTATSTTTSSTTQTAPAEPAVDGISVVALRTRVDIAVGGRFEVRVENTGPEPFTVLAVALDSAGFDRLAPTTKQSVFAPGTITDLMTPYGPVICGPQVDPEPAYAVLDLTRPDGSAEQVRVPMGAPNDDIARMHAEGCAAADIATAVTVTLLDLTAGTRDGAPVLTGRLRLERAGSSESIAVTDMRGSVVLQAQPQDELPATMAAQDTALDVPVYFRQATCDPHYLADTKQPVLFPLWLSFDGQPQEYSTIPVTDEHHDQLIDYLGEVCN